MYTPVQVIEPRRRHLRRAVHLECRVLAEDWDEPVAYDVRDLSPDGMFVQTSLPLEPGTPMYVALRPEGWGEPSDLIARARVQRVEMRRRRDEGARAGMGLRFVDLPEDDLDGLESCLRGLPPRLPTYPQPNRPHVTTVWVNALD